MKHTLRARQIFADVLANHKKLVLLHSKTEKESALMLEAIKRIAHNLHYKSVRLRFPSHNRRLIGRKIRRGLPITRLDMSLPLKRSPTNKCLRKRGYLIDPTNPDVIKVSI